MEMIKRLFFKHLVFSQSNIKKVILLILINGLGIVTMIGLPVALIIDVLFVFYNLQRVYQHRATIKKGWNFINLLNRLALGLIVLVGLGIFFGS
ncbi:hypothetical protein [Acinetobacter venetianus]|uniref:hypothetical protein n=1 Tax=Acinetobacter venetianus TaxID=52133 RepID=UPI0026516D01|nr:hypothetical protein [Acinetobacter sp.]